MTSDGTISISERVPGIVELTIDRPPLNILDGRLQRGFAQQLAQLASREDLDVLIVRGAGVEAFSVGADIKEMAALSEPDPWLGQTLASHWSSRLAKFPCLTICCIEGMCLGGGLEVALCADVRIAAPDASFGFPEVRLGLIPGMGGTVRLPPLVGPSWARRLILTGEIISGDQALSIGLVQELAIDPHQAALKLVTIARAAAPLAQRAAKALLGRVENDLSFRAERDTWNRLAQTNDNDEGIAAFLEHRPADFKRK